jgi:hypothetical protein
MEKPKTVTFERAMLLSEIKEETEVSDEFEDMPDTEEDEAVNDRRKVYFSNRFRNSFENL